MSREWLILFFRMNQTGQGLVQTLVRALRQFSLDAQMAHCLDIHHQLHQAWEVWLLKWHDKGEEREEAELLVRTINFCAGCGVSE
ncbi:unnamed protein product [Ilex paraguariensis]|uniref:Uncharacterized protein n=1 Tax=Ilex paraguariensis TaxID=185542 RepID=A0ABC8S5N5_9AQUA